jgi:hypothetical protein
MMVYQILAWFGIICCLCGFIFIGYIQIKNFLKYGSIKYVFVELNKDETKKIKIAVGFLVVGAVLLVAGLIAKP